MVGARHGDGRQGSGSAPQPPRRGGPDALAMSKVSRRRAPISGLPIADADSPKRMSAIWVLLELVPLAALAFFVCVAAFARRNESGRRRLRDEHGEPEWWSDFEREFALYIARRTTPPHH